MRKLLLALAMVGITVPGIASAVQLSAFGAYDDASCDRCSGVNRRDPIAGFGVTQVWGDGLGVYADGAVMIQSPHAGAGAAYTAGDFQVLAGPAAVADYAELGEDPGDEESTEMAVGGMVDVRYQRVFFRYMRYSVDHDFQGSDPSVDVNLFAAGVRF